MRCVALYNAGRKNRSAVCKRRRRLYQTGWTNCLPAPVSVPSPAAAVDYVRCLYAAVVSNYYRTNSAAPSSPCLLAGLCGNSLRFWWAFVNRSGQHTAPSRCCSTSVSSLFLFSCVEGKDENTPSLFFYRVILHLLAAAVPAGLAWWFSRSAFRRCVAQLRSVAWICCDGFWPFA